MFSFLCCHGILSSSWGQLASFSTTPSSMRTTRLIPGCLYTPFPLWGPCRGSDQIWHICVLTGGQIVTWLVPGGRCAGGWTQLSMAVKLEKLSWFHFSLDEAVLLINSRQMRANSFPLPPPHLLSCSCRHANAQGFSLRGPSIQQSAGFSNLPPVIIGSPAQHI